MCDSASNPESHDSVIGVTKHSSFAVLLLSHREGRNEQQIGNVKKVLVSMRKDQQYRETKMRLLHKLLGIEWLRDVFDGIDGKDRFGRDWFKGYYKYDYLQTILDRIAQGRPISCAASKTNDHHFYVAFGSKSQGSLSYITLISQPTTKFEEEMGVQFCNFKIAHKEGTSDVDVKTVSKSEFKELVGDYALMLPYMKEGGFQENFTLVYHDWDVLECSNVTPTRKGRPVPSAGVFTSQYQDYLEYFIE